MAIWSFATLNSLILETRFGEMPPVSGWGHCAIRSWGPCAIRNESHGLSSCSVLLPFQFCISWISSTPVPGSCLQSVELEIQATVISGEFEITLVLYSALEFPFYSHQWPFWRVSFFGGPPLRALRTGCFLHTKLKVIVYWVKVGTENGNEWEKDVYLNSHHVIYAHESMAWSTYKDFF